MSITCLTEAQKEDFKSKLKNGDITMSDLLNLDHDKLVEKLKPVFGTDSNLIATNLEGSQILKNRMQGLVNRLEKMTGTGRYSPENVAERNKIVAEYRAAQKERIFNPKENESYLGGIVEKKMGAAFTRDESIKLTELSKNTDDAKLKFDNTIKPRLRTPDEKLSAAKYGTAKYIYDTYVDYLKTGDNTIKAQLKQFGIDTAANWETNKVRTVGKVALSALNTLAENSISISATLDDSFLGRQGLNTLYTEPKRIIQSKISGVPYKSVWLDAAKNSFVDMAKTLGGKDMTMNLMIDAYSRPNYLNGEYVKAGIIPKTEEQYPTSMPERIFGIGRVFTASEIAFKGSALRMRMNLYDFTKEIAEKGGVVWNDSQIEDVGKLTSSLTARGQWGKYGNSAIVKLVLWAPRMLKANIDVMTAHGLGSGFDNGFAKKEAAYNILSIIAMTTTIMLISQAIKKDSVEWNPISSNSGKLKFDNTTFDISGGRSSVLTLAARIGTYITNTIGLTDTANMKSTTTGKLSQYSPDFGKTSALDAVIQFVLNKANPPARVVIDILEGQDFNGNKPTIPGEIYNNFTPFSIRNIINLKDNHSASVLAGVITDALGISANTYKVQTEQEKAVAKLKAVDAKRTAIVKAIEKKNNPSIIDKILNMITGK